MAKIEFSNNEDRMLDAVAEVEQLLNDIEARGLYDDAAKLSKIKANFSALHLKMREQQRAKQQSIKMTTNEELFAEIGTGEVECFDCNDELPNTPHVLPAGKLFPNEETKFERELP